MAKSPLTIRIAQELSKAGGRRRVIQDDILLYEPTTLLDRDDDAAARVARLGEIVEAARRGFFHVAATGKSLCKQSKIQDRLGRPLEQQYPDASRSFLNFATTYWTLKIVVERVEERQRWRIAEYVLKKVESEITPLFFPPSGSPAIDPVLRSQAQLEMIYSHAAPIDTSDFLAGNPILAREFIRSGLASKRGPTMLSRVTRWLRSR